MVEPAHFTATPRTRIALSLDLGVLEWVDAHIQGGGLLGGPSHAAERAIQRLKTEADFIHSACKRGGTSFHAKAFWQIYATEIEQSTPTGGGRSRHGHASTRGRVFASIATDLLLWANRACIQNGPFQTMSQVVEVGLRSLRRGDHRLEPGAFVEGMSQDPDALWSAYQRLVKQQKAK